jgi:predicted dinucleotide-binding enzyme
MGSGLARLLASSGINVAIGHFDAAKASALAQEIGSNTQGGVTAAVVKLADVVILATPYSAAAEALREAGDLSNKVVIDISNPITPDFKALTVGHTTSAAEEIQKIVPQARVVKAFNTVFAELLPLEARRGRAAPVQVFIAGDHPAAKNTVSEIVKQTGFQPIEAGPLSNSRYLEPVGEMNIHLGFFLGWGTTAAPAWIAS